MRFSLNNISKTNSQVTINLSGLYLIKFTSYIILDTGGNALVRFFISKNLNVTFNVYTTFNTNPPNTTYILDYTIDYGLSCNLSTIVFLNVNDVIRCGGYAKSLYNAKFGESYFSLLLLSL